VVHLAWSLNIFEIFLTLKIQWMVSFNFVSYVPIWPSTTSLGLWLGFLGIVDFLFWPNPLVAFVQLLWEKCYLNQWIKLYACSFVMHLVLTYHHINLGEQLKKVVRPWSMLFTSLWMPFSLGGVSNKHCKHFWLHVAQGHLLGILNNKLNIPTFSLCLFFYGL